MQIGTHYADDALTAAAIPVDLGSKKTPGFDCSNPGVCFNAIFLIQMNHFT